MMTRAMILAAAAWLGLGSQAEGQVAAPDVQQELRAMADRPTRADDDRERIRAFLDRDDVEEVAQAHGMDIEEMRDRVATLDAQQAASIADRIDDAEEVLPGGDRVVISTTGIIIALLIIILVIVA